MPTAECVGSVAPGCVGWRRAYVGFRAKHPRNADEVHVRSAAETPRRSSWVRLSGQAAPPERIAAQRAASDQRARDRRKAIESPPPQLRPRARKRATGIGAADRGWLRKEVDSLAGLTSELEAAIGDVRVGLEGIAALVVAR